MQYLERRVRSNLNIHMRSCSGSRLFMRSLVAMASEYVRFIGVYVIAGPEVPTTVVATASVAELAVAMRNF